MWDVLGSFKFCFYPILDIYSGKDNCSGDFGGGPLFSREFSDDPWHQIGLVSFGTKLCGNGTPGVYTRVAEYMDWIESKLQP